MKKLVIILLAVCIVFLGVLGFLKLKENNPAVPEATATPEVSEAVQTQEPEPIVVKTVDYEKFYATHKPEEVVLTVNGQDVTWQEYFSWVYSNCEQVVSYMQAYASYGMAYSWDDQISAQNSATFLDSVSQSTEEAVKMLYCIETFAAEHGVELSEENAAAVETSVAQDAVTYCGEGATAEDFAAYLKETYLDYDYYIRLVKESYIYQQCFNELYGENCEKITDKQALEFLAENGYLRANHILLSTVDANGVALEESVVAEKLATAEKLVEELQNIKDKDKLLTRFAELKEEYCEDSGKTYYPDGYVFLPGTMVSEFEDTCVAQEEYEVSDPVLSSYGYHIIITLPQDPDAIIEYTDSGTPLSARKSFANTDYATKLQELYDTITVEYNPGFEKLDVESFLK